VGEAVRRKNLVALLKAFHLEFNKNEQVGLLIKSHLPGQPDSVSDKHLRDMCQMVKNGLKLYQSQEDYHNEVIITQRLTDEQMMQLHAAGDCLVCPSRAEGWNIGCFEAMALGKTVISNDCGGMQDYIIDKKTGLLCKNRIEPVFGVMDSFPELYTGREEWAEIDIDDLRKKMRRVLQDKKLREKLGRNGVDKAAEFSYQVVGQHMRELLEK
jgi:glycosyltransferase involved in cell wall biosynthesis